MSMEDHEVGRLGRKSVEEGDSTATVLIDRSHAHPVTGRRARAIGHRADVSESGATAYLIAGQGGAYAVNAYAVAHHAVADRRVPELDSATQADLPREAYVAQPCGVEPHIGYLHALPILGLAATGHERVDLALRQFSVRHEPAALLLLSAQHARQVVHDVAVLVLVDHAGDLVDNTLALAAQVAHDAANQSAEALAAAGMFRHYVEDHRQCSLERARGLRLVQSRLLYNRFDDRLRGRSAE